MRVEECVDMVRDGVPRGEPTRDGPVWADLGSGGGAFTAALAEILGPGARIVSVDRDRRGLQSQARMFASLFSGVRLETIAGDFTADIPMPPLDGLVLANSLHFHPDPCGVLLHVGGWLKPGGRVVVVEYDARRSGPWVPHPVPFDVLEAAARCAGMQQPRLLARRPSRYHGSMYSAVILAGVVMPQ